MRISDWSSDVCSSDLALIDEFQDTDPVQYRIFETIYRIPDNLDDCGVFMIGDPKQAIYSFRGADIYTYLQARKATAGRHYTLGTNYRSTKAMVEAANHCFRYAERSEEHTSELQSLMRISYAVFCLKTKIKKQEN